MNFALLGCDASLLPLIRKIATGGEHALVWATELDDHADEIARLAPRASRGDAWEALLSGRVADAVLVARGDDERRADQLRKLVQEGVPLLVSHPAHDSMLVYYELEMIRQDSRSTLVPNLPARLHPCMARLRRWIDLPNESPIGRVEQLVCERALNERSHREVLGHFARDADLLRAVCGELTQVGAMTSGVSEEPWSNLSVQLSRPESLLVRWSVTPVEGPPGVTFTLVGRSGQAKLTVPDVDQPWSLEIRAQGERRVEPLLECQTPDVMLAEFLRAAGGQESDVNWIDACRSLELADAIDFSLRRGRTIELHFDEHTEHGTFKGLMSGIGCAVLLGGLLLTIVAAIAGGLGLPVGNSWAYVLLTVMGVFLLLQALKLVFPSDERDS